MSSNNTATPSPRKQSIEDLASSVENLKEKLMRLPFAVAANNHELAKEGEENIPSPTKSAADSNSSATNNAKSEDPLPKKLCDTVYARLKSDAIVCVAVAIITFFLHWSGFFRLLQPNLNYVLWVVAVVTGFLLHYALPQLRKQLPWLCFSHPVLKSREYGQFEVCLSFTTCEWLVV